MTSHFVTPFQKFVSITGAVVISVMLYSGAALTV
jgi:hypothetical protein